MRPPNQTAAARKSLPSRGGRAYSRDIRRQYLEEFVSGISQSEAWLANQRDSGTCPSDCTLRRWRQQWIQRGHILRFRRTGNNRAVVLRGDDLVYLAIYRTYSLRPKRQKLMRLLAE